jgi:hypothetical protein
MAFASQVDILRSRWQLAIGNLEVARRLALDAEKYAVTVGDSRLKLEAQLGVQLASPVNENSLNELGHLVSEATRLGHNDLADSAALILARLYIESGNIKKGEMWLEERLSKANQGRRMLLEGRLLLGSLRESQKQYDLAIVILAETEIEAAANGFLPNALEAAMSLADIYNLCGKISRTQEVFRRADAYARRIVSSLPDGMARHSYELRPVMVRLEALRGHDQECARV